MGAQVKTTEQVVTLNEDLPRWLRSLETASSRTLPLFPAKGGDA